MVRLRLRGVDIYMSFWFFAVLAGFALLEQGTLAFYLLLPIAVHEAGHLLIMSSLQVGVRQVTFSAFGVDIRRKRDSLSYGGEIAVSLGGVLANGLLALSLHLLAFHSMRVMLLVAGNVAVAAFNLLPISNLDGGQVLRLLAARLHSPGAADVVSKIASLIVLALLFGLCIFLFLIRWPNPTLLIALLYLAGDVLRGK